MLGHLFLITQIHGQTFVHCPETQWIWQMKFWCTTCFWLICPIGQLSLSNHNFMLLLEMLSSMLSVYNTPGHILDSSDIICGTYMHILSHICQSNISYRSAIWQTFFENDSNMWSRCCSWSCPGKYMHQCWIYMLIQNEDHVTYICDVVTIFVEWYMPVT